MDNKAVRELLVTGIAIVRQIRTVTLPFMPAMAAGVPIPIKVYGGKGLTIVTFSPVIDSVLTTEYIYLSTDQKIHPDTSIRLSRHIQDNFTTIVPDYQEWWAICTGAAAARLTVIERAIRI